MSDKDTRLLTEIYGEMQFNKGKNVSVKIAQDIKPNERQKLIDAAEQSKRKIPEIDGVNFEIDSVTVHISGYGAEYKIPKSFEFLTVDALSDVIIKAAMLSTQGAKRHNDIMSNRPNQERWGTAGE